MKATLISLILFIAALVSCKEPEVDWDKKLSESDPYFFVSNVPEKQKVGNFNLGLTAFLSRDFSPGGDSIRPLLSIVNLTELASQDIAGAFELGTIEILASGKSYKPAFHADSSLSSKSSISWVSRTGPELDPKKLVDVICEFKDVKTGKFYSLIARRQEIRTPM